MHNKLFNSNIDNANIDNANIENDCVLLTPNEIKSKLPLTQLAEQRVLEYRQEIKAILDFQDSEKVYSSWAMLNPRHKSSARIF